MSWVRTHAGSLKDSDTPHMCDAVEHVTSALASERP